jgi:hypothetical protein
VRADRRAPALGIGVGTDTVRVLLLGVHLALKDRLSLVRFAFWQSGHVARSQHLPLPECHRHHYYLVGGWTVAQHNSRVHRCGVLYEQR